MLDGIFSNKNPYFWICAPSEDSDQPAYSDSLRGMFPTAKIAKSVHQNNEDADAQDESESSLGIHIRRYVLACCGMIVFCKWTLKV